MAAQASTIWRFYRSTFATPKAELNADGQSIWSDRHLGRDRRREACCQE